MGIELKNVSKRFGSTCALNAVSLDLKEQRIYGLLGKNGAGKTTMLNIIANRLYADSGEVLVDGESVEDNDRALNKLFMMGEQNLFSDDTRVKKAFKISAMFYKHFDLDYAHNLAHQFGLNTKRKITALSTGYASVFRIILALSVNTPYLLLDEPVLGLDAQHRDLFYRLLLDKYSQQNCTIIISTHLIQEVANIIEHALIIRDGRIIRDLPVDELLAGVYTVSGPAGMVDGFIQGRDVLSSSNLGGLKTACLQGEIIRDEMALPEGLEISSISLQDYFINLMNGEDGKNASR